MFYCYECAGNNKWPCSTLSQSKGKCEVCGEVRICNDLPSHALPDPPLSEEDKQRHQKNRERLGL